MYVINQNEPSKKFQDAWAVALRYLHHQGKGDINWLRIQLNLPMAEHLSFYMGNQLFFIFVEAEEVKFEQHKKLFLDASNVAGAIPCIIPMTRKVKQYQTILPEWGLIHAETKKPIAPPKLITNELIEMNDWELHDFAIQVVKDSLNSEGKKVTSTQSSMDIDPSIWFEEEGEYYFVVVRATRFPDRRAVMPENIDEIVTGSTHMGKKGFFASVAVAGVDPKSDFDPFESELNADYIPLYRGNAMSVLYKGLEEVIDANYMIKNMSINQYLRHYAAIFFS